MLTGRTVPNGRFDVFAYDQLGRLTQVDLGTLKRTRYIYDDASLWTMTREDRKSQGDGAGTTIDTWTSLDVCGSPAYWRRLESTT